MDVIVVVTMSWGHCLRLQICNESGVVCQLSFLPVSLSVQMDDLFCAGEKKYIKAMILQGTSHGLNMPAVFTDTC